QKKNLGYSQKATLISCAIGLDCCHLQTALLTRYMFCAACQMHCKSLAIWRVYLMVSLNYHHWMAKKSCSTSPNMTHDSTITIIGRRRFSRWAQFHLHSD